MASFRFPSPVAFFGSGLLAFSHLAARAQQYTFTDLGTLGGSLSQALGIGGTPFVRGSGKRVNQ